MSDWKVFAVGAAVLATLPLDSLALSCLPGRSSYEVGTQVVFVKNPGGRSPTERLVVSGADPKTFKPLLHANGGPCSNLTVDHGIDSKHVYYEARIVEGADPATFIFMTDGYARDKGAIYARGTRLTTRVDEFRRVGRYSPWATDGEKYFYHDNIVEESGLRFLPGGYARTATTVYHDGRTLRWADADTFEVPWPFVRHTRDKTFVYYADQVIPNADPGTFEQIRSYVFKDKRAVYVEGRELSGSDPASARVSTFTSYVIDDRTVYRYDKAVPDRDPATFEELQHPWSRDKNGVYYEDHPFPADLATFKATALQRAEDKNYRFSARHKYCKFDPSDPSPIPICK